MFTPLQCEHKFKYLKARYIKKTIFGDKPNLAPPALAGSLQSEDTLKLICDGMLHSVKYLYVFDVMFLEPDKKINKNKKRKNDWSNLTNYLKERHHRSEEEKERRHREKIESSEKTKDLYREMMGKLFN